MCVCIEHSEKFCCFIAEMRNGGVKIYSQIQSLPYKSAVNRSGVIKYQKKRRTASECRFTRRYCPLKAQALKTGYLQNFYFLSTTFPSNKYNSLKYFTISCTSLTFHAVFSMKSDRKLDFH